MKQDDKDFLKKLVLEKRFPLTEKNTTKAENERVLFIMDNYTDKEIRAVMTEAKEEME